MTGKEAGAKLEIVKWSSTFSVGVKVIDDQHKELLNLLNDMFNHVSENHEEERKYFSQVVKKAVNYVKVHFQTEEKFMIYTMFPGYAEHKKAHDTFTFSVIKYVQQFEEKKRFVLLDFTKFLKEWVLTHIAVMDKQYFDYFKRIATRKADGSLSINSSDIR